MTQRVGLTCACKNRYEWDGNSVKVCMAKTIKNDNAMPQRVGLHVHVK